MKDASYAFETPFDSALQRSDDMWRERVESTAQEADQAIFIAFSDTLPIGMAALVRIKERPDTGELMQVWVSPDCRGTRAAWELMDGVLLNEVLLLEVLPSHECQAPESVYFVQTDTANFRYYTIITNIRELVIMILVVCL